MHKLILRLSPQNKNSIRVLAAALEPVVTTDDEIVLLREAEKAIALEPHGRHLFLYSFLSFDARAIYHELERLRPLFPHAKFIGGGPHASVRRQECLEHGFDYVAAGEGEILVREIYHAWINGLSWQNIPGLFRLDSGKLTGKERDDCIDLDHYSPMALGLRLFGPIEIARGCPYRCQFCQTGFMSGKVRFRSEANILSIVENSRRLGFDYYRFLIPNALGYRNLDNKSLENVESMLKGVRRIIGSRKLFYGNFPSEVRPEFVTADSAALLAAYCDNQDIVIGAQSGSPRLLKAMKRRHGTGEVARAVELLHRHGLRVIVDFIFGLPGETDSDQRQTFELISYLLKYHTRIRAHIFMPLPGTPWENEPPGNIDNTLAQKLASFTRSGHLEGDWKKQLRT